LPNEFTLGFGLTMNDYTEVTEAPGNRVTAEALEMVYTRYAFAADLARGKDVLELACGAGQGLGLIAGTSKSVVGADYTERLLGMAKRQYGSRVPLVRLDAQVLPFREKSFDVVLLYEAIYYLGDPRAFVAECYRVLRDDGVVVICTVNREWSAFNPSPGSTQYLASHELRTLLSPSFAVKIYGAFPVTTHGVIGKAVSVLKRLAVRLNLIPKTMKGKELLKRFFLGELKQFPCELLARAAPCTSLSEVKEDNCFQYKVLFAVGHAK
jgi:ubiquinone/menaquinone biosynthesis C-methylase UbiE